MFNFWKIVKQANTLNKVLPVLLMILTGKDRYKPDFQWCEQSWIYNIFRIYEFIFWRRIGIRKECASYRHNGKLVYDFFTIESVLVHGECVLRNFFHIQWIDLRITSLQLAWPGTGITPFPWLHFAIALDVASNGTDTTTSPLTWSHTVTGSNPLLAIGSGVQGGTTPTTTVVSYNSVGATKARADVGAGSVSGAIESSAWLLGSASVGANTVSITATGITHIEAGAVSYSGAQSVNTADASGGLSTGAAGAKTFNVTTVANNCWVFSTGYVRGTSPSLTLPTQTSRWSATSVAANCQVGQDTNGPKTPAGAVSSGWTVAGSGGSYCFGLTGCSFAPAAAATAIFIQNIFVRQAVNRSYRY